MRKPKATSVVDENVYVRLPLPPELVRAMREHFERGQQLLTLLQSADAATADFARACVEAGEALTRDVGRARKLLRVKRGRARRR